MRGALAGGSSLSLAARNLGRNRWRTALTVAGVAVAVGLLVWATAMTDAFLGAMVRSTTSMQLGDLQVHAPEWLEEPSIWASFAADAPLVEGIRGVPGVAAASRRLHTFGLVGTETRSQVALVEGIEPDREPEVTRLATAIVDGRWLTGGDGAAAEGPREVVLGEALATRLGAKPGDELVVMLSAADGSLGDDRLRVVGIARTGISALDRQASWMRLPDVAFLAALEGRAHELAIRAAPGADLDLVAGAVATALAASGAPPLSVRTWRQIVPELHQMLELASASMWFMFAIIYSIAALGILNAQRMSALERRREFGVMLAVGVTPARLGATVAVESVLLTAVGAVLGAGLGWAVSAWHSVRGLDMASLGGGTEAFTYQGVTFEPVIYFEPTGAMVLWPAVGVLGVGLLCGLWPALASARLDAVRAIAGRS